MLRVPLHRVDFPVDLALPVYDTRGRLVMTAGSRLEVAAARRLQRLGITAVTIDAQGFADLRPAEPLDLATQADVMAWLSRAWDAAIQEPPTRLEASVGSVMARRIAEVVRPGREGIALVEPEAAAPAGILQALNAATGVAALAAGRLVPRAREDLVLAALLRDIGMARGYGWDQPEHVAASLRLLEPPLAWPPRARVAVAQHHERLDGSGFPRQLRGDEIDVGARILAVVDTYLALQEAGAEPTGSPAKGGMPPHEAAEYVVAAAGYELDMETVGRFAEQIVPYPAGTLVQLSDGTSAVVVSAQPGIHVRPAVRRLAWTDAGPVAFPDGEGEDGSESRASDLDLDAAGNRAIMIVGRLL